MPGDLRFVVAMLPIVVADTRELQRQVADLAEFVSRQNRYLMRSLGRKRIPPLYETKLVYRNDPWGPSFQHIPDALTCLERGWIDCKGAVPYRVAELREQHPSQNFHVHTYPRRVGNDVLVHLQVGMPDGTIEDPSRFLRQ